MSYFITHSGERVDIATISAEQIHIEDIAHHLTNIQRYNGAIDLDKSYSVAQHCINVASYIYEVTKNVELARYALLHDAAEAYLGDIISGVKAHLPDYQFMESRVESLIYKKYSVRDSMRVFGHGLVKAVDKSILLDESKAIFPQYYNAFAEQYPELEPLGIVINPHHTKQEVYDKFMLCCKLFRVIDEGRAKSI